jgi:ABC-type ATPase involved in cell division
MSISVGDQPAERSLTRVEVSQLLGRFDHSFDFAEEQEFLILHGPNGIGKTKLLELISSTFSLNVARIAEIPFSAARFEFSDGNVVQLERTGQEALPGLGDSDDNELSSALQIKLIQPGGREYPWDTSKDFARGVLPQSVMRIIEREAPVRRITPGRWTDMINGEVISTREVLNRYIDYLPRAARELIPDDVPREMRDVLSSVAVHLIETQRLINTEARGKRKTPPERRPTVLEFSEDFSRQLGDALAQNSRVSQDLDRSFPRRLLSDTGLHPQITEDTIRARYEEQSETRRRLTQISVLDASGELPLPRRTLENWEKRVLWTYLDDTERKLRTFQDLLDRVALLREIVNSRFLYKELILDREGFHVVTKGGKEIPADKLSSGEQHELVLAYDLLFTPQRRSLVLIDEPEISLHVVWQKEFLNDLARISAITSSRFLVATHSPQIIHKYWSHTVGLEPGYENEELWK